MQRSLHFQFQRERVCDANRTEADALEQMQSVRIRALHAQPNPGQPKLLAPVVQRAQQQLAAESAAAEFLVQKNRQLRFAPARSVAEHRVPDNPFADGDDELIGSGPLKFEQPITELLRLGRRQTLELGFGFEAQVHDPNALPVVERQLVERNFHHWLTEHCRYHAVSCGGLGHAGVNLSLLSHRSDIVSEQPECLTLPAIVAWTVQSERTVNQTAWQVFWIALFTDFATGLGALPFAFSRTLSRRWEGISCSIAGGMMISASVFSLAEQGLRRGSVWAIVAGMLAGAAFFWFTSRMLVGNDWKIENLSAKDSRQAVLIVATMFVHSIPEGIAIGVGYATGDLRFGLLLAVAIAVHNIPEGIAISLPLRAKGVSTLKCAGWAIFTSIPQPVFAVPAFLLVSVFHPLLPFGLGFAGGAMIFLVAAELMPESIANCSKSETAWGFMIGLVLMLLFTSGLGL
jgi:ZIP family zinc transporter